MASGHGLEPNTTHRHTHWRLAFFYAAYFAHVGAFAPYWPLWLEDFGFSATLIGWTLSIGMWIRVLTNPVLASVSDRWVAPKIVMLALTAGALLTMLWLALGVALSLAVVFALTVVLSIFLTALNPIGEAYALHIIYQRQLDYGRIRLWGSLAFIALSFSGGWLIEEAGLAVLPWFYGGIIAVIGLSVALLPKSQRNTAVTAPRPPAEHATPLEPKPGSNLSKEWMLRFALFLAAASLIQSSHAALYGFASIAWQQQGLDSITIGWLWAEGVVVEIALFAGSAPLLRRLGAPGMLALGGAAAALRWSLMAATPDLLVLSFAQALHGFSFGAAHLAAMHYITQTAPPGRAAFMQSLYTSVAVGLAMGAAMAISGKIYSESGAEVFTWMAGLAVVGTGLAICLVAYSRKRME